MPLSHSPMQGEKRPEPVAANLLRTLFISLLDKATSSTIVREALAQDIMVTDCCRTAFLVMAVPNAEAAAKSSDDFRSELETKINTHNMLRQLEVRPLEVSKLNDEDDMGECFVVELSHVEVSEHDDFDGRSVTDYLLHELGGPNAEAWVTSSSPIPLPPPYGWRKEHFKCEPYDTNGICDCLHEYGLSFIISGNKLTENQLYNHAEAGAQNVIHDDDSTMVYSQVKSLLDEHVTLLEETVGQHHPHINLGESAFGFQEYTHRGPGRFEVLFEPTSTLYQMLRDSLESNWIQIVCQYLRSNISSLRLNISCVYSRPGASDQDWHTDGVHYNSHGVIVGEPREHQPYAICIFFPLIPLTEATGFTRFWPRSHLYPNLLGLARAADALQATIDGVNLHPGDFIMYDYTTWHKGVGNMTDDVERPIIQFLYSCDWYKERENYGTRSVFEDSAYSRTAN